MRTFWMVIGLVALLLFSAYARHEVFAEGQEMTLRDELEEHKQKSEVLTEQVKQLSDIISHNGLDLEAEMESLNQHMSEQAEDSEVKAEK